jgi:hypothetical protein
MDQVFILFFLSILYYFIADLWYQFDDHIVKPRTDNDILGLCGGGDWHMNYIHFYREVDRLEE